MKTIINKGDLYGMLTIVEEIVGNTDKKGRMVRAFKCKCECKRFSNVLLGNLTRGTTKSCGCYRKRTYGIENPHRTHGMTRTRIYNIWQGLRDRCNNKNGPHYSSYGGRGISYDSKWKAFEGFYEDMKESYSAELSLDRIDVNGNYCKENCRWATQEQQANNTRSNILYKGSSLRKCCRELLIDYDKVYARVTKLGWTIEQGLGIDTPPRRTTYHTPRRILHRGDKEYFAIRMREKRLGTLEYFNLVNNFEIEPRDIDEKKIFNSTDLHYIKNMNKEIH